MKALLLVCLPLMSNVCNVMLQEINEKCLFSLGDLHSICCDYESVEYLEKNLRGSMRMMGVKGITICICYFILATDSNFTKCMNRCLV